VPAFSAEVGIFCSRRLGAVIGTRDKADNSLPSLINSHSQLFEHRWILYFYFRIKPFNSNCFAPAESRHLITDHTAYLTGADKMIRLWISWGCHTFSSSIPILWLIFSRSMPQKWIFSVPTNIVSPSRPQSCTPLSCEIRWGKHLRVQTKRRPRNTSWMIVPQDVWHRLQSLSVSMSTSKVSIPESYK